MYLIRYLQDICKELISSATRAVLRTATRAVLRNLDRQVFRNFKPPGNRKFDAFSKPESEFQNQKNARKLKIWSRQTIENLTRSPNLNPNFNTKKTRENWAPSLSKLRVRVRVFRIAQRARFCSSMRRRVDDSGFGVGCEGCEGLNLKP